MTDSDRVVTVTVRDDCEPITCRGAQVGPGEEFEVWESQVPWLREQGIIGTERPRKNDRKNFEEPPAEQEAVAAPDTPTEG